MVKAVLLTVADALVRCKLYTRQQELLHMNHSDYLSLLAATYPAEHQLMVY